MKSKLGGFIVSFILASIIFYGLNYFMMLPINIRYTQTVITFLIILKVVDVLRSGFTDKSYSVERLSDEKKNVTNKVILMFLGLYIAVSFVTSSEIFNSGKYSELIGEVSEPKSFTTDFSIVNEENLPVVNTALAQQLGDKEFGKIGSLGSEFHIGQFSDISVDSKLYAIAPLEYNDFFKWFNNQAGTPGYVIVDKVSQDVNIVNNETLKYTNSSYFNSNLKRHIYYNGGMKYRLTNFSLELDEDNNPHWVVTALQPTIGLTGGEDVAGVFVVDPESGLTTFYNEEDVPSWVDTVYPEDIVMEQINKWGKYQDGWLNSILGQKNVVQTTYGSRRVYNGDDVFHYTGLTSIASDEATIGFMFVNTRTKEVTRYNMSGATELAAMSSAEGAVQNYGYVATFPIPVNINNQPTFFITLKDNQGLIKQYSFVNIAEFSIVGIGSTIEEAKNNYLKQFDVDASIYEDKEVITGVVKRISSVVLSSETYYYILLEEFDEVYEIPLRVSNILPVTNIGDKVEFSVYAGSYLEFANNTLYGELEEE